MVIFFRCNISANSTVESEVHTGVFSVRFRLIFTNDSWLVETKRSKRMRDIDSYKDIDEYKLINCILTAGLPPVNAISIIAYNLRLMGYSEGLKSFFIINWGLNHNTIRANSYVTAATIRKRDIGTNFDSEFSTAIKIKFSSILAYFTRILFAR